MLKLIAPSC